MKRADYILKIDNPCGQDWDSMISNETGKFCSSCSKAVVDFSNLTDSEILKLIDHSNARICGRLNADQLNRTMFHHRKNYKPSFIKIMAGLLFIGLSKTSTGMAQNASNSIVKVVPAVYKSISGEHEKHPTDSLYRNIKGKIIDKMTQEVMVMAQVAIKGTEFSLLTDKEGLFSFLVPDSLPGQKIVIVVSSVGFSSQEFTVDTGKLNQSNDFLITEMCYSLTGEIVIIRRKLWWQFWK